MRHQISMMVFAAIVAITVVGRTQIRSNPKIPLDAELLRHFQALVQIDTSNPPGKERATSIPTMLTASTDMAQLREKGIQSYGVGPAMTTEDFALHAWHSDVERLSENALYEFGQFVYEAVSRVVTR